MKLIDTIRSWGKSMDKDDIRFLLSTLIGIALWWGFIGRKRYSTKGMR